VWEARRLYEGLYGARGERENRIKEQLMLFADRTSTAFLRREGLSAQRVRTWKTSADPDFDRKKNASGRFTGAVRPTAP
ncbi:MAG: hypothetical protein HY508_03765, partial [Acidobacteria bacterium]|nr:hypothetical protein [Acidobacteriota bacterium]